MTLPATPEIALITGVTGQDGAYLAETVMDVVGFKGKIIYDSSKPDGTPRKLLDVSRMKELGWQVKTGLRSGIEQAYADFLSLNKDTS